MEDEVYGGMMPLDKSVYSRGYAMVSHGDDTSVPVMFWSKAVKLKGRDENGKLDPTKDKWVNKDYVRIFEVGSKDYQDQVVNELHKKRWPNQWQKYLDKAEEQWDGTPLKVWPQVDTAMINNLNSLNIHTVEQLADASDGSLDNIGMGARELQKRAKIFLQLQVDEAIAQKLASDNDEKDERIAKLEAQIAELSKKKSPGKPRKRKVAPKKKTEAELTLERLEREAGIVREETE
jgi:hypothetical protein